MTQLHKNKNPNNVTKSTLKSQLVRSLTKQKRCSRADQAEEDFVKTVKEKKRDEAKEYVR